MGISEKSNGEHSLVWQTWLRTNGSRLLLFARQLTRSVADAEDVIQAALVRLLRESDEPAEPSLPRFIQYIRWGAMDHGRRETRRLEREQGYQAAREVEVGPYFEVDFAETERAQLIQAALEALSQPMREVVVLKIWGEMTHREIAEALDLPLNTVSSRYRYGLEALRKQLGGVLL